MTLLSARLVEASISGVTRNPVTDALRRVSEERSHLTSLGRTARAGTRSTWYLGKVSGGLEAAREMLRQMIAQLREPEAVVAPAPRPRPRYRTASQLGLADPPGEETEAAPRRTPIARGHLAGKRIVLDAGHGGSDEGATGSYRRQGSEIFKLREKDLTLDVATRLADRLRAEGAEVFMTRTGDETLDLYGRGVVGRVLDADLFMSVHFNYSDLCAPTPRGGRAVDGVDYSAVYVYQPSRHNLAMPGYAEELNERLRSGQPAASNQLASLVFQRLTQAIGTSDTPPEAIRRQMRYEESRRWQIAHHRRKALDTSGEERPASSRPPAAREAAPPWAIGLYNAFFNRYPDSSLPKGVRRSDFVVLREVSNKPAVLVESCFIGDRTELLGLRGDARRRGISNALFQGICDYLRK